MNALSADAHSAAAPRLAPRLAPPPTTKFCRRKTRTPETLRPLALPCEDLAVQSAVASSGYRPAVLRLAPATCPSASPFRSTFDSRLRSTLRLCLAELNLRLSPAINPPELPPTSLRLASASSLPSLHHRTNPLHLQHGPPINLRLASPTDPPALPSNSTSDSHRSLYPSAAPSNRPPTCVGLRPFSAAIIDSTFGSRLRLHLQPGPPIDPELSFPIDLPAWPSNSTSD